MDRWDVMTLVGLVLIGVAVWLTLGLPAAIAYAGVVVALVGVAGALARRWPVDGKAPDVSKPTPKS
jgi:hypothetical protein